MDHSLRYRIAGYVAIPIALSLCGCATHRTSQFSAFANAGSNYTDAMVRLTDEAGAAAIDADSDILLKVRGPLNSAERKSIYREHTEALNDLLGQQQAIRQHTLLLKQYFSVLARMAGSDAPDRLGKEARQLAESISGLSPRFQGQAGSSGVAAAAGSITPLVVAAFRNRALENELRTNGPVIQRELELQHAALLALSGQMRADLATSAGIREYTMVIHPYIDVVRDHENWKTNRKSIVYSNRNIASVDAAEKASKKLGESYRALIEGRLSDEDIDKLLRDIKAFSEAMGNLRSTG